MKKIMLILLIIFYPGLVSAQEFVVDEKLVVGSCPTGWEETGMFESGDVVIKHCVRKEEYNSEMEFVVNSYFNVLDFGEERCPLGGSDSGVFEDEKGNSVYLCVEREKERTEEFRSEVKIEELCGEGFEQEGDTISITDGEIVHCSKKTESGKPESPSKNKRETVARIMDEQREERSCSGLSKQECSSKQGCSAKNLGQSIPNCGFICEIIRFFLSGFYTGCEGSFDENREGYYCYSENINGLISGEELHTTVSIPARFYYEEVRTANWSFKVREKEATVHHINVINAISSIETKFPVIKETPDHAHCLYGSFSYQRPQKDLAYTFPFLLRSNNQCFYLVDLDEEPLQPSFSYLGGEIYENEEALIDETCPGLRGGYVGSSANNCPLEHECTVSIPEGKKSYYGFTFEVDSCDNRVIKEDNGGVPLTREEINERANSFFEECSGRYEEKEKFCGDRVWSGNEQCDPTSPSWEDEELGCCQSDCTIKEGCDCSVYRNKMVCEDDGEELSVECESSDINAVCHSCRIESGNEQFSEKLLRAVKAHESAINRFDQNNENINELVEIRRKLEEARDLYDDAGKGRSIQLGNEEALLSALGQGRVYLALGNTDLARRQYDGLDRNDIDWIGNIYDAALTKLNNVIKYSGQDNVLLSQALMSKSQVLQQKAVLSQNGDGLAEVLQTLESAVLADPSNSIAEQLLSDTRVNYLKIVENRMEENINDLIAYSLINSNPGDSEDWITIKNAFGNTLNVFRGVYQEYVHLSSLSLADQKSEDGRELIFQEAGINLLIALEREGGDISEYYTLTDNPNEQKAYLRRYFTNEHNLQDYNSYINHARDSISRAFRNPDVVLILRNGKLNDPDRNGEDNFGYPAQSDFIFATSQGYFPSGNSYQKSWYDDLGQHINVINLIATFAPFAKCAQLGGRSLAGAFSSRFLWSASAATRTGRAVQFGAATSIAIGTTEGLASIGVPLPFADFIGNLVDTPQSQVGRGLVKLMQTNDEEITRLIFKEAIDQLPGKIRASMNKYSIPHSQKDEIIDAIRIRIEGKDANQIVQEINQLGIQQYTLRDFDKALQDSIENAVDNIESRVARQPTQVEYDRVTDTYLRDGIEFSYNPRDRVWSQKVEIVTGTFNRQLELNRFDDLEAIVDLESRRIGVSENMVRTAYQDTFKSISPRELIHPADYERRLVTMAEQFPTEGLTDKQIMDLVTARGIAEGLTDSQLTKIADQAASILINDGGLRGAAKDIASFVEILDGMDATYKNVYLLRDGSFLQEAELIWDKAKGKVGDARLAFVSRGSVGGNAYLHISDFNSIKNANGFQTSEEFYDKFYEEFNFKFDNDPEFRESAETVVQHLDNMGILDNERIRLIDTCCVGTMNLLIEGAVHRLRPDIQTETFLMHSNIRRFSAGLDGRTVERFGKPGSFDSLSPDGDPLMRLDEVDNFDRSNIPIGEEPLQKVKSYLMELVTAQETLKRAVASN